MFGGISVTISVTIVTPIQPVFHKMSYDVKFANYVPKRTLKTTVTFNDLPLKHQVPRDVTRGE